MPGITPDDIPEEFLRMAFQVAIPKQAVAAGFDISLDDFTFEVARDGLVAFIIGAAKRDEDIATVGGRIGMPNFAITNLYAFVQLHWSCGGTFCNDCGNIDQRRARQQFHDG